MTQEVWEELDALRDEVRALRRRVAALERRSILTPEQPLITEERITIREVPDDGRKERETIGILAAIGLVALMCNVPEAW